MKLVSLIILLSGLTAYKKEPTPTVTVDYLPKQQWKASKGDLSAIKETIEHDVRV
jgi:hypothetical protein